MPGLRTPLYDAHKALGARMIDFGGWDLPVSYPAGTLKEPTAVREAWAGYTQVCGPCTEVGWRVRPDVLLFY